MSSTLLFEIGVEEMPAGYILADGGRTGAAVQLGEVVTQQLRDAGLWIEGGTTVNVLATPRRLAVQAGPIAAGQPDRDDAVQGPAVKAAFDANGQPTRALVGFCQGKGVDVSQVRRVQTPKGEYVEVTVHRPGKPALEVLPDLLAAATARLTFPKTMRWLADDTRFARPVRWLVALLDADVVAVRAFGLSAGRTSYGHRFLSPGPVEIARASDYAATLAARGVRADHLERERDIRAQLGALGASAGGRLVADDELVEINNFLVERPTAFLGSFDRRYLDLPREVIVMALREHQRFFAVEDTGGSLLPHFMALRNGDDRNLAVIRTGNEGVLVARLEDAKFYWDTDLKHPPASRVNALASVVWMEGMGTLREKASRLETLVGSLAAAFGVGGADPAPESVADAKRAALLCKTDLLSEMIGSGKEYAALEGIMGGHYARRAGEPDRVAAAIAEHYLPRGRADALPETEAGTLLSLADKLDHVAGAFAAGKVPSGSEDPFAVRRAANGVLRVLLDRDRHLDLFRATMQSTAPFFGANPELSQAQIMKQLGAFWADRVRTGIAGGEAGDGDTFRHDTIEAAMESRAAGRPGWADPADCRMRARVLHAFRGDARFEPLVVLFKRVANILAKATETLPAALDRAGLSEKAEADLAAALDAASSRTEPLWAARRYDEILPALLEIERPIHAFFDTVMVNVDDVPTRLNRLKLLANVREQFVRGWDLSRVVVEGDRG
ncbi:MAG: glycine--tRNA ligase subunit beta [Candidatus Eisenbacteria bacterium]